MARAIAALVLAWTPLVAGAAEAEAAQRFGASAGIAVVRPAGGAPGSGSGFYAELEYLLVRDGWLTPRLYAGGLLTGNDDPESCGPGVAPCDVSAQLAFAGARARLLLPVPRVSPYVELGLGVSGGRFTTRSGDEIDSVTTRITYQVPLAVGLAWGERRRWHAALAYLLHPEVQQVELALTLGLEFSLRGAGRGAETAPGPEPEPARADGVAAPPGAAPGGGSEGPPEVPPEPPEASAPAVAGAAPPDTAPSRLGEALRRRKPGSTYVAARFGIGGGVINGPAGSGPEGHVEFVPVILLPFPSSVGAGFGVKAGRHLLLGGEWNLTVGFNCVASMNSASGPCDRGVLLQQLLAVATVFPLSRGAPEAAPAGPFVRGGAGWAFLRSWPADIASTRPEGEPAPEGWRRNGPGALAGLGYSVRLLDAIAIDAALDFSWQSYGSSPSGPQSSFSSVLHAAIRLH